MSLRRILVANRGEIAIRIMRACREMGIASVAVYSEADRDALHVALAEEAVPIGGAPAGESYLNIERMIAAARQSHCDAIHPGYGFLSERAEFAQAVREAGLTFIGPSPESIRAMGSKINARDLMRAAGVPTIPGYQRRAAGNDEGARSNHFASAATASFAARADDSDFTLAAGQIGYPLMVKASAGGGGKGMRVVSRASELQDALESARREAENAFGDHALYLEKLLRAPHHVEFQVIADRYGHTLHLLERECSVQRRHQKIIEETPSPLVTPELRAHMGAAAVAAARAVNYVNAGTIEFLVDSERQFYFLEMNTRLQVEHPITEALTGFDLVKWQIHIAAGEALSCAQEDVRGRGHAIECRVYAEDPANNFLPSTGRLLVAVEPRAPGVRVDAGVTAGKDVTRFYDPMIAKVIVHAETRAESIARMDRALADYTIVGVATNIPFLRDVLASSAFQRGEVSTDWVDEQFAHWSPREDLPEAVLIATALMEMDARGNGATAGAETVRADPWLAADRFRLGSRR